MNKRERSSRNSVRRPKSKSGQLEEYIMELEQRESSDQKQEAGIATNVSSSSVPSDIFDQLAQKEKDLVLAAELGKALLERNEELTLSNERITEEYSAKLELLEQEKHGLKRRMDTLESEYEARLLEVQTDLSSARKQLQEQQSAMRGMEKDKSKIIQELMEQNQRLTRELKEASESEDNVSTQLQSLREQFNVRRSNLHDHVAQLEGLREEITILGKRKSDLEKRIAAISQERGHLSLSLDESSDRILMLEMKNQELESAVMSQQRELEEFRHANSQLHRKLETRTRHSVRPQATFSGAISPTNQPTSLFNEIEMSSSSSIEEELSKPFAHDSDEDIECDLTPSFPAFEASDQWKFRQEISSVYQSLRRMLRDLHRRRDASGHNSTPDSGVPATPEEMHTEQVRTGLLATVVQELQSTLKEIFPDEDGPCSGCRSVAVERNELAKLRKDLNEKSEIMKRMTDEKNEILKRVTVQEVELGSAREERDNVREALQSQGMPKDEIVKRAFELRDQAVARKNVVEIELAKSRIEIMHINSQLMESVQQKIELSQQLEQWQVDMQCLLDDQLKKKLTEQEEKRKSAQNRSDGNSGAGKTGSLALGIMSRSNKLLKLWR